MPASLRRRFEGLVLGFAGYFVPLFHFVPNTWMFMGIMSMPLVAYFSSTAFIPHLWDEFSSMLFDFSFLFGWHGLGELAGVVFLGGVVVLIRIFILGGFALFICSLVHLYSRRGVGVITDGPYGLVRHPQYLGIILMTGGVTFFTSMSSPVWVWGDSSSSLPRLSIFIVFVLEVLAYILLASIEELRLESRHREEYAKYQDSVPFINPVKKLAGKIRMTPR